MLVKLTQGGIIDSMICAASPNKDSCSVSFVIQTISFFIICLTTGSKSKLLFLTGPEKGTLKFFALRALQFWEMALVFYYYLGKFGFNIFLYLENKQIKYLKKLNLPTSLLFWLKQILFTPLKNINFSKNIPSIRLKLI